MAMKKIKAPKEGHTANTKYGMGDFYGQAVKNPSGRLIDTYMNPIKPSRKKGTVKSLA